MLTWQQIRSGLVVTGLGCQNLLTLPMTAFFASRQCPGSAIRAAMDWALDQARSKHVLIGGFHSPLEQSVLKVLIEAHSPVVVVLARPVEVAKLPPEWLEPLAQGQLAVASTVMATTRLTRKLANTRNDLVARIANQIVVAHASPGGALEESCAKWQTQGLQVLLL